MRVTPLHRTTPTGAVIRGSLYQADDDTGGAQARGGDLVVLHHGFGSTRTEALGLFMGLTRRLCARGYAVASFDRPGHGESDGEFEDITIDSEIEAAASSVDWLCEQPGIDARAVHLLGMSMGGVVAAVAASRTHTPVSSLVLWSPAAVFADEFRAGTVQGRPFAGLEQAGFVDFLGLKLSPAYVAAAVRFDPYAAASGYAGPVRVLHGADDAIVPPSYALRYAEVYGDRAEVTVVAGADHGWASVQARATVYDQTLQFLDRHRAAGTTP